MRSLLPILLALVVLVTGFFQAVSAVKETNEAKTHLANKERRLAQLNAFPIVADGEATLRKAGLPKPASMRKLVSVYLEGQNAKVIDLANETPAPGWRRARSKVTVLNLPWPELGRFLERLNNQPHPWRLAACELKPGAKGCSGSLTFETIGED